VFDVDGSPIDVPLIQTVGFMGRTSSANGSDSVSFIKNERIGATRRTGT
jgi:hypothetical protein